MSRAPISGEVTARAPASVGNLGVGFDLLGLALEGPHDKVSVQRAGRGTLELEALSGAGHEDLPRDADHNTAMWALRAWLEESAAEFGLRVRLHKGIPLNAGMGGSAASAVAALVAANALLERPLDHAALALLAAQAEVAACGSAQADNAAPSLLGGLVLAPMASLGAGEKPVQLMLPKHWRCVLVYPRLEISTRDARRVLAPPYALPEITAQAGHLASFVAGTFTGDAARIAAHVQDGLVEPRRAPLIPGFDATRSAAVRAGALAFGISGSGPSLFALAEEGTARSVADAMQAAFSAVGLDSQAWVSRVDAPGAQVSRAG